MKIGIIGGASVRSPLLVRGLAGSGLPIEEAALYDPDQERLALMAPLVARVAPGLRVRACATPAECVEGAGFVFTSIRVGGTLSRARYERISLEHGVVAQETVGAAGFAMAMATVPHMIGYAREVARRAPEAWIVNFTNPVGIVTEAVIKATGARILGICDTPTELFEECAHALGVPSAECYFDYFGLNHLGWLRELRYRGRPRLGELMRDDALLARLYRAPFFSPGELRALGVLPTEYLYFYYHPERALQNLRAAGTSRGAAIQELNARLLEALRDPTRDPVAAYEAYLAERSASYRQLESGSPQGHAASPAAALTGYDKIAVSVVGAIHDNSNAVIPLSVRNGGNLPDLRDDDVVEVPCQLNANGALPLHVGRVPETVRELLLRVKEYERLTVEAALSGSAETARRALAANPLVARPELAERLVAALA
jgi:6-phospho-beta-glucosidase